jgi:hypothetical protein
MSLKKFKKRLQFNKRYEIYHSNGIYTGSIGYLTQSSSPEIFLLTFEENLLVYNSSGKLKQKIPFTNKVCKLFITENLIAGEKVFISLAYSGEIRVFSQNGDVFWKVKDTPLIDGVLGNLDYDPKMEIVSLQENNQISIYNDTGNVVAKYIHHAKIHFITLAKLNSSEKNVILFVDSNDKLYVLDIETQISEIPLELKSIRALDSLTIYNTNVVVILDNQNYINFYDKKGHLIDRFSPKKKVESIFTGYIHEEKIESLFVITKDSYLINYKIDVANAEEFIDGTSGSNKNKMKRSSTSGNKTKPYLEVNANYYNEKMENESTSSDDPTSIQKSIIPKKTYENLKCPECKDLLPRSLIRQIIEDKESFCEKCGVPLSKSDFKSVFN